MASNNLRILHDNLTSSAILTASSSASANTLVANLKSEIRSNVWRSAARTSGGGVANILVSLTTEDIVNTVVLNYTNLLPTSTMRVRGWSSSGTAPVFGGTVDSPTIDTTGCVLVFDSGSTTPVPSPNLGTWYWGSSELGSSIYSGYGSYARTYIDNSSVVKYVTIEITNPDSNVNFIEASYLMVGKYWSPKYNTGYGMSTQFVDKSSNIRTEAGDLISRYMPGYSQLTFDLKWLASEDKAQAYRIFRTCGKVKPVFISLFPEDAEDSDKESLYQIIGKLRDTKAITHPVLSIYSTSIEIEEL